MPEKKQPQRQCLGCMERRDKKELIRIIRTPEAIVELDFTGRKNGRGAYICNRTECLAKARMRNSIARALKCEITPEIYDQLLSKLNTGPEGT